MVTFLIVFGVLAGLTAYAIFTSRAIDEMEEAEREAVEDHNKRDMCREDTEDG